MNPYLIWALIITVLLAPWPFAVVALIAAGVWTHYVEKKSET